MLVLTKADGCRAALTPRQIQILRYIAYGLTLKETAARLGIAQNTACNIRLQLSERLGLRGMVHLARFAISRGIAPIRAGEFE